MRQAKRRIMKIRGIVASAIVATGIFGGMALTGNHAQADAGTTTISTTTSTKTIVNAKCYLTNTKTTTTYHHSAKTGWVKYPSPKVTTSKSEHCDK
jgi:hypothetical protein